MGSSSIGIRFGGTILKAVDLYSDEHKISRSLAVNRILAEALGVEMALEGQDKESGAAANEFGRKTAAALAMKIGAKPKSATANEFSFKGRTIGLKCARRRTSSVGLTYTMLNRIDAVIAALERDDGAFDLYELAPTTFRATMRPTASKGPSSGRVGIVSASVFRLKGKSMGRVAL